MTTITGYLVKFPKPNVAARRIATSYWGDVQGQRHIRTKAVDGYVGSFSTTGHGGLIVVSKKPIDHPAMTKKRHAGNIWPYTPRHGCKVYEVPENVYIYVLEEDCDWARLLVALPEIAPDVVRDAGYYKTLGPDRLIQEAVNCYNRWKDED